MEHIYTTLLRIYDKFDNPALRGRVLQCLGKLIPLDCRSHIDIVS